MYRPGNILNIRQSELNSNRIPPGYRAELVPGFEQGAGAAAIQRYRIVPIGDIQGRPENESNNAEVASLLSSSAENEGVSVSPTIGRKRTRSTAAITNEEEYNMRDADYVLDNVLNFQYFLVAVHGRLPTNDERPLFKVPNYTGIIQTGGSGSCGFITATEFDLYVKKYFGDVHNLKYTFSNILGLYPIERQDVYLKKLMYHVDDENTMDKIIELGPDDVEKRGQMWGVYILKPGVGGESVTRTLNNDLTTFVRDIGRPIGQSDLVAKINEMFPPSNTKRNIVIFINCAVAKKNVGGKELSPIDYSNAALFSRMYKHYHTKSPLQKVPRSRMGRNLRKYFSFNTSNEGTNCIRPSELEKTADDILDAAARAYAAAAAYATYTANAAALAAANAAAAPPDGDLLYAEIARQDAEDAERVAEEKKSVWMSLRQFAMRLLGAITSPFTRKSPGPGSGPGSKRRRKTRKHRR